MELVTATLFSLMMLLSAQQAEVIIGYDPTSHFVNESGGSVALTLRVLQGQLRRSVLVTASTLPGSATDGKDYINTSNTYTFDSSTSTHTLAVPIVNDDIHELNETFNGLLATDDSDVNLIPARTTITIQDDDKVTFSFSQRVYIVREDDDGGIVCLKKDSYTDQTLQIMLSGALQPGLGVIDQVITFQPNEMGKCVTFNIKDDNIALEVMEQLTFTIAILSQVPGVSLGTTPSASVIIMDIDELVITMSNEGCITKGVGSVSVCMNFSNPFAQPFSLILRSNQSYSAKTGMNHLNFPQTIHVTTADSAAGELCYSLTFMNNSLVENEKCFTLKTLLGTSRFASVIVIKNNVQQCCIEENDPAVPGEKNSNLVLYIVIATIAVALLLVIVVTVIIVVLVYKKRQQQQRHNFTLAQVTTPLNTIETMKEKEVYEKIDDNPRDEKYTSLQETTKCENSKANKRNGATVPSRDEVECGAAGYSGGEGAVALMENVSYGVVGTSNVAEANEYQNFNP